MSAPIQGAGACCRICAIDGINLSLSGFKEGFDQINLSQLDDGLIVKVLNGSDVNGDISLDSTSAGFCHPSPIDETILHKSNCRDGGKGFVKVLNLDGSEVYAHHITVYAIF